MRAGWIVSTIGHVGAVIISMLVWETTSTVASAPTVLVPVDIVSLGPEASVRALSAPTQEAPQPPPAPQQTPQAEPAAATVPTPRNQRQQHQMSAEEAQRQLLQSLTQSHGARPTSGAPSDRNRPAVGPGRVDQTTYLARIASLTNQIMARCWRNPGDLPNPERLVVTVSWELDRNGNLRGNPQVTSPTNYQSDRYMNVAAQAALRAVRECQPYPFANDPILADHYDLWRHGDFTFRPHE